MFKAENNKFVSIKNHKIGPNYPPYIVAELSANHLGNYDHATKIMEEAAIAGVHALKIQTYTADTLSMDIRENEFLLDGDSPWAGMTQYELYQKAYTPWEWHKGLFDKAASLGLTIFSSPFDETSVDFLEDIDCPAYKIASYELIHLPLIAKVASTNKPLIFSTGLASLQEITDAVETAEKNNAKEIIILHTIGGYPTPIEEASLGNLKIIQEKFPGYVVGISDHSPGSIVPIVSIGLGARFIEKHLTLRRIDGGEDAAFSLEPEEMAEVVTGTRLAWESLGTQNGQKWTRPDSEQPNKVSRRSIYVSKDIQKGEILTPHNIKVIRPHFGLQPKFYFEVIGMRASEDLKRGTPLSWEALQQETIGSGQGVKYARG
ncbi:MAG: pseudaminic acid synthase [Alphaproteobacteria bacterium]|nr:pseudaminic acid synthase [Alphaproteobacteria bacterium]